MQAGRGDHTELEDELDLSGLGRAVAESRRRRLAAEIDTLVDADPAVAIRLGVAGNDAEAQRARLAIANELLAEVTRRSDDAYRRAIGSMAEPYVPQPFGLVAVRENRGDLIAAMTDPSIRAEMIDYLRLDTYHRITADGESWVDPLDQAANRGLLADAMAALQSGQLVEPVSSGEAYDDAGNYQRPVPLPGIVEAIAAHQARQQRGLADLPDDPDDPRRLPEPAPEGVQPRESSTRLSELLDSIAENLEEARRIINDQTVDGDGPERSDTHDVAGHDPAGQPAVSNVVRSDMTAAEQVRADARREELGPEQFRVDEIELLARVDPVEAEHARMNWRHRRPERAAGQSAVDRNLER